jgi:hypothetical protein
LVRLIDLVNNPSTSINSKTEGLGDK